MESVLCARILFNLFVLGILMLAGVAFIAILINNVQRTLDRLHQQLLEEE